MIKAGKITLEQFKENPDIVYNIDGVITTTKKLRNSIAIGNIAGRTNQNSDSIAIGTSAGSNYQYS